MFHSPQVRSTTIAAGEDVDSAYAVDAAAYAVRAVFRRNVDAVDDGIADIDFRNKGSVSVVFGLLGGCRDNFRGADFYAGRAGPRKGGVSSDSGGSWRLD